MEPLEDAKNLADPRGIDPDAIVLNGNVYLVPVLCDGDFNFAVCRRKLQGIGKQVVDVID